MKCSRPAKMTKVIVQAYIIEEKMEQCQSIAM